MTLYSDDRAVIAHAEEVAGKAAKKKSRKLYALSAVGVLLAGGGVAFAAMTISSNEADAKVAAGKAQNVQLSNARVSGPLYPGMSVDVAFDVTNPNPFPVTLTSLVAGSGSPKIACDEAGDEKYISTSLTVAGSTLTLPSPVTVGPNGGTATVTIAKAVKLGKAAAGGCSIEGTFKVSGSGAGTEN